MQVFFFFKAYSFYWPCSSLKFSVIFDYVKKFYVAPSEKVDVFLVKLILKFNVELDNVKFFKLICMLFDLISILYCILCFNFMFYCYIINLFFYLKYYNVYVLLMKLSYVTLYQYAITLRIRIIVVHHAP